MFLITNTNVCWVFPSNKKVENGGNFLDDPLLFVFVASLSPFFFILHIFKAIIWHETSKFLMTVATVAESVEHRQWLSHEHSKGHLQTGQKQKKTNKQKT